MANKLRIVRDEEEPVRLSDKKLYLATLLDPLSLLIEIVHERDGVYYQKDLVIRPAKNQLVSTDIKYAIKKIRKTFANIGDNNNHS